MNSMAFSLIHLVVIVIALTTAFMLHTQTPNMNGVLKFFVIPLAVAYGLLIVLNTVLPGLNALGLTAYNYVEDKLVAGVGSMGYIEVFPPLIGVLLVFMILAYSGIPRTSQ